MVILNTISLGMENINPDKYDENRAKANLIFTWIFIIEMLLKLYVMGAKAYVRDTMCLFDGLIVATSVMELISSSQSSDPEMVMDPETGEMVTGEDAGGASFMSVFKTMRIFRVLKTLKTLRVLRTIKLLRALDYL